jgi:hypothetical protein
LQERAPRCVDGGMAMPGLDVESHQQLAHFWHVRIMR